MKRLIRMILFLSISLKGNAIAEDEEILYNPRNLCIRLTTNTTALLQWIEPVTLRTEIMGYTIYYTKYPEIPLMYWQTQTIGNNPLVTINDVELETVYTFRIKVNTLGLEGLGPISEPYHFKMLNRTRSCYDHSESSTIKSLNILRAAATSYTTVDVWWNFLYDSHYLKGFQVFYGIEDSKIWQNISVGLTQSVELTNLKESLVYKIALAAVTNSGLEFFSQEVIVKVQPDEVPIDLKAYDITSHSISLHWTPPNRLNPIKYKITYDALKKFINSSGNRQEYPIEKIEILVDSQQRSCILQQLVPYTNYNINVSAIPIDYSYRPSAKITARTEMSAPPPIEKPELFGTVNGGYVQILLPRASEEHGPISYYYVIVIPQEDSTVDLPSTVYSTDELLQNEWGEEEQTNAPYIAAKFSQRLPYAFILGNGENGGLFKNRKLEKGMKYKVFVRAVVVTDLDDLFTDSPYSDGFSLDLFGIDSTMKDGL